MQIDSKNLVDVSNLNVKKFDNIDVKNKENAELKKVADDFEAFFLKQIMDISLKNTNIGMEGPGSDIIKGMYTEAISNNSKGSFGISTMLYEFLSEQNKLNKK